MSCNVLSCFIKLRVRLEQLGQHSGGADTGFVFWKTTVKLGKYNYIQEWTRTSASIHVSFQPQNTTPSLRISNTPVLLSLFNTQPLSPPSPRMQPLSKSMVCTGSTIVLERRKYPRHKWLDLSVSELVNVFGRFRDWEQKLRSYLGAKASIYAAALLRQFLMLELLHNGMHFNIETRLTHPSPPHCP